MVRVQRSGDARRERKFARGERQEPRPIDGIAALITALSMALNTPGRAGDEPA
jgi:hypothetical protein